MRMMREGRWIKLHKHKTRVKSDRYDEHMESKREYGMGEMMEDTIPVDLYGKRVFKSKADSNLQEAAEDIKEFYDLGGNLGLKGGE